MATSIVIVDEDTDRVKLCERMTTAMGKKTGYVLMPNKCDVLYFENLGIYKAVMCLQKGSGPASVLSSSTDQAEYVIPKLFDLKGFARPVLVAGNLVFFGTKFVR